MPALTNNNAQEFADIGKAASRSRSQFFIIEPYSFGAMSGTVHYAVNSAGSSDHGPASRVGGGIEDLAGVTSGELFSPSGTVDAILERVGRESSAYYLLGFEPTSSEINGKSHKIGLHGLASRRDDSCAPGVRHRQTRGAAQAGGGHATGSRRVAA